VLCDFKGHLGALRRGGHLWTDADADADAGSASAAAATAPDAQRVQTVHVSSRPFAASVSPLDAQIWTGARRSSLSLGRS
jgi:hypothetical protein